VLSFKDCVNLLNLIPEGVDVSFLATLVYDDMNPDEDHALDILERQIRECARDIVASIAGAETGVKLNDRLSQRLGLRTNGVRGSEARRNKYLMGPLAGPSHAHTHTHEKGPVVV
jgi:hypothetical protein